MRPVEVSAILLHVAGSPLPAVVEGLGLPGLVLRTSTDTAAPAALFEKDKPAVVLLEMGPDAAVLFSLLERLRADPAAAAVPRVVIANTSAPEIRVRAFQLGAADVLVQPVERDELRAKLIVHTDAARRMRDLEEALQLNRNLLASARQEDKPVPDTQVRQVLDQLVAFVGLLESDGTVVTVNQAPLRSAGLAMSDVVGRKFWNCYWWNYSPAVQDQIRASCDRAKNGETVRFDIQVRGKNDTWIWIDYHIAPMRTNGGVIHRLVASGVEISDRKRAQAELAQQTARLEAVLQACPAGIVVAEKDGRIIRMNPANDRIWGQPPLSTSVAEYAEWRGWWADDSPRRGERIKAEEWALSRALRGEIVQGDIVEIEPFDEHGVRRYIINSAAPVLGPYATIVGGVVVQMDITSLKEAEQALRESEDLFRGLAENIPQMAWMTDAEGNIFWYNQRWYEFTGTRLEDVKGWDWQRCQHPDHVARVTAGFRASMASGEPWEDTFPLRRADGVYRWFLSRAFPLRTGEGAIVRWFGTNTDITDLKETQLELRNAQETIQAYAESLERTVTERTERLRETVQELETFSYSIAHDMRAPLRTMSGYCDLLLDEAAAKMDPQALHYVQRIKASANRLDTLIKDILDYSRIVRRELPLEIVDLEATLHDIIDAYPNLRGVRDRITWSGTLPRVLANRAGLTQVFSNLLSNAVKFVPKSRAPEVRIRAELFERAEKSMVRLWLEDNGIGIDPTQRSKLFQMFQRLAPSPEFEGTGMGLAIARKAVERMGGDIGVESTLGEGSQFWIVLPAASRDRDAEPAHAELEREAKASG